MKINIFCITLFTLYLLLYFNQSILCLCIFIISCSNISWLITVYVYITNYAIHELWRTQAKNSKLLIELLNFGTKHCIKLKWWNVSAEIINYFPPLIIVTYKLHQRLFAKYASENQYILNQFIYSILCSNVSWLIIVCACRKNYAIQ